LTPGVAIKVTHNERPQIATVAAVTVLDESRPVTLEIAKPLENR
jgi:hypothetical protein